MTTSDVPAGPTEQSERPEDHERPAGPEHLFGRRLANGPKGIGLIGVTTVAVAAVMAGIALVATGTSQPNLFGSTAERAGASASPAGNKVLGPSVGSTVPAAASPISAAKLAASAGALPLPANKDALVRKWDAGRGGADLARISADYGAVTQSGGIKQYGPMKAACGQLAAAVATAEAGPTIPDAAMQELYAQALAGLARGAADCRAAISVAPDGDETVRTSENPAILHKSTMELADGARAMYRATAQIEIVGPRR